MILAAIAWPSNAELIEDVAKLGYLRSEWRTLDPTYGKGVWWKKWRPNEMVTYCRPEDGSDFRHLPEPDQSFDAIAFDPPYVCVGGRSTTGLPEFHERFGLTDAPTSPAALQVLINAGLIEARRLLRPDGMLLIKCQDYISSGKFWNGTGRTSRFCAETLGLEIVDRFEMIGSPRPQPSGRRQVHARRNLSTLFVFRKPK